MAKSLCLLFFVQIALTWANTDLNATPINLCMTEFKEKCEETGDLLKKFIQVTKECKRECGEALGADGVSACWTAEEDDQLELAITATLDRFKAVVEKAAEMLVGDCPTMPLPTKIWTFDELFGKAANYHHFKGDYCKKAFFHKFLPEASVTCLTTCILTKLKDAPGMPSLAEEQEKLDWLSDPEAALPKFLEDKDLRRAAMCIVNSCDMKILLGAVEQSGLKALLEAKKNLDKNKEMQQVIAEKCACFRGVAEKNGVDLSGLESLDCANLIDFLKKKGVCVRLVREEAQVVRDVLRDMEPQ